jgi:hypothetical protein
MQKHAEKLQISCVYPPAHILTTITTVGVEYFTNDKK